jgi:hypothetical protein
MGVRTMILEYLKAHNHVGKENAVKQSILKDDLGMDRRVIRAEIETINNDQSSRTFINFCNDGIYIVATSGEVKNMRARAVRAIERNVSRLKKCDIILSTTRQLDFEELWDEDERNIWR